MFTVRRTLPDHSSVLLVSPWAVLTLSRKSPNSLFPLRPAGHCRALDQKVKKKSEQPQRSTSGPRRRILDAIQHLNSHRALEWDLAELRLWDFWRAPALSKKVHHVYLDGLLDGKSYKLFSNLAFKFCRQKKHKHIINTSCLSFWEVIWTTSSLHWLTEFCFHAPAPTG